MATTTTIPAIDYTNKDFNSLRQAMLGLARYRLPEWTDQSPSDLGSLLVDMFCYMGDVVLYYQDRLANENFLQTAVERRSVLNLLRLVGYELAPPVPSSAELSVVFNVPGAGSSTVVTIPQGAQFASTSTNGGSPQSFQYQEPDLTIDLASDQVQPRPSDGKLVYSGLPVVQSAPQPTTVLGSSTGEPNQMFAIPATPVILDTLVVEVNEGSGWVQWTRVDSLLYSPGPDGTITLSSPEDRIYYTQFDENDVCWVITGDAVYGMIPPPGVNNMRATFSIGGGSAGNVPANSITIANTPISLFNSVANPAPAAGGADHEDISHAVVFGPMAYRSGQRAVTLNDYVALAQQAGGVAKVRAGALNWNVIQLYVAPQGPTLSPVPESLRRDLIAYFEDKRMAGTVVDVLDATPVPIDISIELVYDPRYRPDAVRQAAQAAVQDLLAFANVDFAQPLYLSDVYGRVEVLPGVSAMTVTRFRREDSPTIQLANQLQQLGLAQLTATAAAAGVDLSGLIQRALQIDVAADGKIEVQDFEIPVLGVLDIQAVESSQ
jgi:Baseplate J-like protein